jgi:3-deoxy-D-manno-octulosonic-acid transferase
VAELLDRSRNKFRRASASPACVTPGGGSPGDDAADDARVILVDTVGQLRDVWGLGQMAFVGGSLCREGGHNMIEPASYGIPVCFGPDIGTFQAVVDIFLAANAAVRTDSADALRNTLERWLQFPFEVAEMGARARLVVEQHSCSVPTTLRRITALLPGPVHKTEI